MSDVAFEFDLVSLLFRDNRAHESAYDAVLNTVVRFTANEGAREIRRDLLSGAEETVAR